MSLFRNTRQVAYKFGDEQSFSLFPNITSYVDILDQLKDQVTLYEKVTIQEGERPDQLSARLYRGNPTYHWTFFLVNDHLREQGWPVSETAIRELATKRYPHWTVTTKTNFSVLSKFLPGDPVEGLTSGSTGVVVERNLDLGQIVIQSADNFNAEIIVSGTTAEEKNINRITAVANSPRQYNAVHHYKNSDGVIVDIDPFTQNTSGLTPVTYLDRLIETNADLKHITVIKSKNINSVVTEYYKKLAQ